MEAVATVAAFLAVFLLGVMAGWRMHRDAPEAPQTPRTFVAGVDHVHEATTFTTKGWQCECGVHRHVYMFPIDDSDTRRCVCGRTGVGKEWA
jgi:hypothetical protein